MTIQLIKPSEVRDTAGGAGIEGRRGVLYQTVDEKPSRVFIWDGEKHVNASSLSAAEVAALRALLDGGGTDARLSKLFLQPRTLVVAGTGTPTVAIEDAYSQAAALSPSYDNPVQILLPPGTYNLAAATIPPDWVSVVGAGVRETKINVSGTKYLRMSSGGRLENLTIAGTTTTNLGLLRHGGAQIQDGLIRNVNIYHPQASNSALNFDSYNHSVQMENVNIWTSSVGVRARGMMYLRGCSIHLSGDNTGTPYVGIENVGAGYLQLWGCKIGNGYAYTSVPGFNGDTAIVNDPTASAVAIRIKSGTGSSTARINSFDTYCFVANALRDNDDVTCVYADTGIIRLYGGIYQAESQTFASPSLTQAATGVIETYGARYSRQLGNIRGYAGLMGFDTKTIANNNEILDENGSDGVILLDASGGSFTLTLNDPATATSAREGTVRRFKKINAANTVTIRCGPSAGGFIDGAGSVDLSAQWSSLAVAMTATGWIVLP